eukprot:CAMPEP_0173246546 /NCGR_PEP_ID=MMETSP1142-20121109/17379_1 /TAXON_ID=483371 /ORGANISM="non described non described, Strain CCMP2298" /LENGTH=70 /DNA_ID=CAMNT_0014178785 /DNA_START=500 /DNA_END=709 /DNA_ORIENTATION=+
MAVVAGASPAAVTVVDVIAGIILSSSSRPQIWADLNRGMLSPRTPVPTASAACCTKRATLQASAWLSHWG